MTEPFCYRGRQLGVGEITFIQQLISDNPRASRRRLSVLLCQAWQWAQSNGRWRDMVARGLLLQLHRAGRIVLPVQRFIPPNNAARHRPPEPETTVETSPLECSLGELGPLEIRQVRRRPEEGLCEGLLQSYHYLRYRRPVGEHLKHLVYARGRPIAALAWSSAPRHLAGRDQFVGWPPEVRRRNLCGIAYQTRFLILPWVKVRHLASHLLGQMARRLSADWQALYGHPVYLLETFVDTERFAGTSYRAANWVYLGLTTGRGHNDHTNRPNRSRKALWVYPLQRDFRRRLCAPAYG
jgi:hypothetical protein